MPPAPIPPPTATLAGEQGGGETVPARVVPGRFTVVVPSFQQGQFLERTLRSILDQDCPDVELIVRDGGSTDESADILRRYGARLRWVSKPDAGQSAAINEGLRQATGEFLCYVCSDDVLLPGALRRVREFFTAHPEAMAVYGMADFIDENDRPLGAYPVGPWDYARLRHTCFICQPACFWRRELIDRHGPFDESLRYAMDYEYWLRAGATTPFHFLQEKLAASRCHPQAKFFDQAGAALEATVAILRRYNGGKIPPRWIAAGARDRAERRLREPGPWPVRWARFVFGYWAHLWRLAPQTTAGGATFLWKKAIPPCRSASRKLRDEWSYQKANLSTARPDAPAG